MRCPECDGEMVAVAFRPTSPAYVGLPERRGGWEVFSTASPHLTVIRSQDAQGCPECGAVLVTAADASAFRPAEEEATELEAAPAPQGRGTELEAGTRGDDLC